MEGRETIPHRVRREGLRIAFVSVHASPLAQLGGRESGGMNVYVREMGRALGRRGIQIDIFTRWQQPDLPQIIPLGENVRVVHLPAGGVGELDKNRLYPHLPEFLYHLLRFKEVNRLHYHLVHSHYWLSGWVARFLRQRWQVPWIAMFHTLGMAKKQARVGEWEPTLRLDTERRVVTGADLLVACSDQEREHLLHFYRALPHKVKVIPCGVDMALFRPMAKPRAKAALGLSGQEVVLFVGRIEPLKGIEILIRTVAQLEDHRNLCLLIVGGDGRSAQEFSRLRAVARELGIAERVRFLGRVEQEKLPLLYSAADVCVVPSYYESFCLVALEALACATPVVASRVGGLKSTVRDGETGFLIPWRCPGPFAERLELLLGNQILRRRFGKAGVRAARDFRWSLIADRMLEVYNSLLTQNRGRTLSQDG